MKKVSIACALAFILSLSIWTTASACGDKFLVLGKGIRYERARAAVHPGSILIYRNLNHDDQRAGSDLEKALKKVGHKVQSVDDVTKLEETLQNGEFDLVVVNLADAPLLEDQIVHSPSKPVVLPIIYNRTGTELAAAGKQYDCILKAAGKNTNVLKVVDDAVGEKKMGAPVKCNWSK